MPFFATLRRSFYSAALYARLRRDGNYAFGYSFLLVGLTTLVAIIFALFMIHQALFLRHANQPPMFDQAVAQIAAQVPSMTLRHGQLATREAKAYPIALDLQLFDYEIRGDVATIDTTGRTTTETMKTPVLITAHAITIEDEKKTRVHDLREYSALTGDTLVINRSLVEDSAKRVVAYVHGHLWMFYWAIGSIGFLVTVPFYYVLRLILLVVLAAAATLIDSANGGRLKFPQAMAVAAVAITPASLAGLLAMFIDARGMHGWLSFAGGAAMLAAALYASRDAPLAHRA